MDRGTTAVDAGSLLFLVFEESDKIRGIVYVAWFRNVL